MERDLYFANLEDLTETATQNKAYTQDKKAFSEAVSKAMEKETGKEKAAALKEILNGTVKTDGNETVNRTDIMDSSQFMLVFNSFRAIGEAKEMIDLYNRCPNKDFTEAPLVQELLAKAYIELEPPQTDKALEITDRLLNGKHSGVVTGRAYDVKARALTRQAKAKEPNDKKMLKKAAEVSKEGFKETLDTSLGLTALHRNLEIGETDEAKSLANVVFMAALRDGAGQLRAAEVAIETDKQWSSLPQRSEQDLILLSTAIQAGLVSGKSEKEMELLVKRLKDFPVKAHDLEDLKGSLKIIQNSFPSKQLENILGIIEHKEKFCEISSKITEAVKNENEKEGEEAQKAALQELAEFKVGDYKPTDYELKGLIREVDQFRQKKINARLEPMNIKEDDKEARKEAIEQISKTEEIQKITAVIDVLQTQDQGTQKEAVTQLDALYGSTYSYRGLASDFEGASVVSGNMKFGGQLPEHSVAKKDLDLFSGLLEMPLSSLLPEETLEKLYGELTDEEKEGLPKDTAFDQVKLNSIKNPETFMRITDKFIRYHFGNDDNGETLEKNALLRDKNGNFKDSFEVDASLKGGSKYDQTVSGTIHVMGKEKGRDENQGIDSRTNISAIFALGLGDCRHHAQVKQIMFDMWQKKQMNEALTAVLTASNEEERQKAMVAFGEIYLTELRSTDIQVKMPVEMTKARDDKTGELLYKDGKTYDAIYRPDLEGDKFKRREDLAVVEEHTMTVLVRRDTTGELSQVGLRDAFYQHEYSWGNQDVELGKVTVDKNGKLSISVNPLSKDKSTDGKEIPITLSPTGYNSGKRDSSVRDSTGDDICLIGIPLKGFESPEAFVQMLSRRDDTRGMLDRILAWEKDKQAEKETKEAAGSALRLMRRSAEAEQIQAMEQKQAVGHTQTSEKGNVAIQKAFKQKKGLSK